MLLPFDQQLHNFQILIVCKIMFVNVYINCLIIALYKTSAVDVQVYCQAFIQWRFQEWLNIINMTWF